MNLWHDIPLGKKAPDEFNVIVEIPKNSNNKYEIDKETGLIALDRANYGSSSYPFDYGFAPQTYWEDEDALDVIVMTTYPLNVGIVVKVRPVAVMRMIDSGDPDDKIIAVPTKDKRWDDVQDITDINKHNLKVFQDFFENYKNLKNGKGAVQINGFEGQKEALEAVKHGIKLYNEKFGKK